MNKYIIKIQNVKKNFNHRNGLVEIFKNINLTIKAGELVALVGPSGSGKSTLLHMLALLEKPTGGKILFSGLDSKKFTNKDKDNIRKNKVSLIFQNNNLLSDFTAFENILMPLIIKKKKLQKFYK